MARLALSPQAVDDISDVLAGLTERAGRYAADDYAEQFRSTFDRLVDHPRSGSPRPRFGRNVRIVVVHPYLVIYRVQSADIVILRVMHGHRRITRRVITERNDS